MKKLNKVLSTGLCLAVLFLTSCNSDDDSTPSGGIDYPFENGVFVLNEGNFGAANSSVSFLSNEGVMTHDIYSLVNGEPLGDVAQSIYMDGDLAYIVINGSGKIEVLNRFTFEKVGTISSDLVNPRYMTISGDKGYVTNWGNPADPDDDFVAVVNLENYTVSSTIPVTEGPEQIVAANGKLFVAQNGGWGFGNTVAVISTSSQNVIKTIQVHDVPASMAVAYDVVYVLCSGKESWTGEETLGGLTAIDALTDIEISQETFAVGSHPNHLVTDGSQLFYSDGDLVYAADLIDVSLSNLLFSTADQGVYGIYGLGVNKGKIYVADAVDYISDGRVLVYKSSGELENVYNAGLLPNDFGFNN